MNQKEICRLLVDRAIISLWLALRDLSDHAIDNEAVLTSKDWELWGLVTDHPAVQDRIQAAVDKEKEERYNRFID